MQPTTLVGWNLAGLLNTLPNKRQFRKQRDVHVVEGIDFEQTLEERRAKIVGHSRTEVRVAEDTGEPTLSKRMGKPAVAVEIDVSCQWYPAVSLIGSPRTTFHSAS